ncbi:TPA: hypothetical protein ACH1LG_004660 [Salmonella enterica]|jgi:hypothetical protein|uniref:Uncharacterized protein n=13 Tax=root TaxID=1 RepID=A0A8S5UI80_9CAUD|nr:hypothetical protein [Enterococcus faecium]ELG7156183.1 hypothetical protein [Staphylococcus aureus]DAF94114.1 MAG TPA: hypothetical protein [Myoviridae sp. ctu2j3]HDW3906850.1 hypothetical protein [Escherichia coli]ELL1201030.1 hypothetical protein [Staphylococcus aureus]MDN3040484.1 hypothetical protein [Enterococcus faecium]
MPDNTYGALTIDAQSSTPVLPVFDSGCVATGHHTNSRYKGQWALKFPNHHRVVSVELPQRDKHMQVSVASRWGGVDQDIADTLAHELQDLDAKYEGSRWLYKLQRLLETTSDYHAEYVAIVNNQSEHPSFSILSQGLDLGFYGVYDTVNRSTQLAWSTDPDFVQITRAQEPTRYLFHRYPTVKDRPLFIHTENVCSKWYVWKQAFTNVDGVLKAFNVLENFLFKNPEVAEFRR